MKKQTLGDPSQLWELFWKVILLRQSDTRFFIRHSLCHHFCLLSPTHGTEVCDHVVSTTLRKVFSIQKLCHL